MRLKLESDSKRGVVRSKTAAAIIACANALSACSGLDPEVAAQHNYDQALADYQNCLTANQSNEDACAKQRQEYDANAKLLAGILISKN